MKKLKLIALATVIGLVSCTGGTTEPCTNCGTDSTKVITDTTAVTDSTAVDTTAGATTAADTTK